jgi:primosomal protein N' (replication factor Y)
VPVIASDAERRVRAVPDTAALVVATPGAEPEAEDRYAAGVLLDGDAVLHRPGLAVGEEAVRRWTRTASLVRHAPDGVLALVADPAAAEVQALVADAPERYADRACDERAAAGLPPAAAVASVVGEPGAVRRAASWLRGDGTLDLGAAPAGRTGSGDTGIEVLGPARTDSGLRLLLLGRRSAVVATVRDLVRRRATDPGLAAVGPLTVRVDPPDL